MEGKYGKPTLITSRITIDYEKDTVDIEKPECIDEKGDPFILEVYANTIGFSIFKIPIYIIAMIVAFLLPTFISINIYIDNIIGFSPLYFPIFIYLIFRNRKDSYFEFLAKAEYYNNAVSGRYRTEVTSLDKPIYEITCFNNIFLEYNVEGEFSKYLRRIEIREQTFIKEHLKPLKLILKYILRRKEKSVIGHWKATFYFSDIPKTGKLTVWLI